MTSIACIIIGSLAIAGVIPSIGTGGGIALVTGGLVLFIVQIIYLAKTRMKSVPLMEEESIKLSRMLLPREFFVYYDPQRQVPIVDVRNSARSRGARHAIPSYFLEKCFYKEVTLDTLRKRYQATLTSTHDCD